MNSSVSSSRTPIFVGLVLVAALVAACGSSDMVATDSEGSEGPATTATESSTSTSTTAVPAAAESAVSLVIRPEDRDSPVHIAVGRPDGEVTFYAIVCEGWEFSQLTVSQGAWFEMQAGASVESLGIEEPIDPRDDSLREDIWFADYVGEVKEVTAITWGAEGIEPGPTTLSPPSGATGVIVTATEAGTDDETKSMTAVFDLNQIDTLQGDVVASTFGADAPLESVRASVCG